MAGILKAKLHHMRVHPHDGKSVKVTHHSSANSEPFAEHHFEHPHDLAAHVLTHSGMPEPAEEAMEHEK